MAKGRKLTTSQSERFLGTYGYSHNQGSTATATATDPSELREEDIWSTGGGDSGEHEHDLNFSDEWESTNADTVVSNGSSSYRDRRRITQNGDGNRQLGGLSLAFEDPADDNSATATARIVHQFRAHESVASSPRGRHMATSLPVNVPDWSKILRVDSVESLHDDSLDDDDEDLGMVPPHEYLARSRKTAAKSVFEGVGRTLKGRDLSRVRDAVWSQTGFDG